MTPIPNFKPSPSYSFHLFYLSTTYSQSYLRTLHAVHYVYSTDGGQTWNNFASLPTFPGYANGGTIAASTPQNIIMAPADGVQPYYTLNGGQTWNPVNLPGVTDWSNFEGAYYLDERDITADRVFAEHFLSLLSRQRRLRDH